MLVVLALALAALVPLDHADSPTRIPGQYIVRYHPTVTEGLIDYHLRDLEARPIHRYHNVYRGFAAKLSDEQLLRVRQHPFVAAVEADQTVHALAECTTPEKAGSWGQVRISEINLSPNDKYAYPVAGGSGVDVFVVDTGIYVQNADFGGRATFFWKAESSWSNTDGNGHGTHVASTAGGSFYGVAPLVNLYAVKVLGDDGSGTNSGVIAGVDRVTAAHSSGQSKRTVANLSLGGGYSSALNDACDEAVDAGVVMVVAAGNEDDDACYSSPASATKVISVGSTDVGVQGFNEQIDERSSFSNYGECVDIFAPGSDITAAWIGSSTATATISGTSMASPHVAGVAALVLSTNPSYSSTEVRDYILNNAVPNKISLRCANNEESCRYSPNLLLNNGCNV